MGFRTYSAAILTSLALIAGCSNGSTDVATDDGTVPWWIREGVRIARDTKASWDADQGSGGRPSVRVSEIDTAPGLPERSIVVAGLTALGLAESEANCMYDNLAANADATETAVTLLSALSGLDPTAEPDPATLATLTNVDEQSMTRVVMSVVPCLSPTSLGAVLAAAQGLGAVPGAGIDPSALAALGALDLDPATIASLQQMLATVDIDALARLAAGGIGPDAVGALAGLIRSSLGGVDLATLAADPLLLLNLDKLDLTKIPSEQLPLVMFAIIRGLTPAQQRQLQNMAQVTFNDLELAIDPTSLSSEELGSLLLILSPLIASAVRGENAPPPGWDPSQIYIPPGADLADMNPLLFMDRDSVIASFEMEGVNPRIAACFFDSLRELDPRTLALLFSTTGNEQAISSVALAAIVCVLRG